MTLSGSPMLRFVLFSVATQAYLMYNILAEAKLRRYNEKLLTIEKDKVMKTNLIWSPH